MAKSKPPTKPQDRARALVELAEDHFGGDLTNAERAMFWNAALGRETRLPEQSGDGGFYEPASGDETGPPRHWPRLLDWIADFRNRLDLRPPEPNATPESLVAWKQQATNTHALASVRLGLLPKNNPHITIRADRLRWLLADHHAQSLIDSAGVTVKGTIITGQFDLSLVRVSSRLILLDCVFSQMPDLFDAKLNTTAVHNCVLPGLNADRMTTRGNLFLDNITALVEVRVSCGSINGQLSCVQSTLSNPDGCSLRAEGLKTKGSVVLDDLKTSGSIHLTGATIDGQFTCANAHLSNPGGNTLVADGLTVRCGVFMDSLYSAGRMRLLNASITGQLNCKGSTLYEPNGAALSADGLEVIGSVFLDRLTATGGVGMLEASISGQFSCKSSRIVSENCPAINADGATFKGGVFLDNLAAKGEIRFVGAAIRGQLNCRGGTLDNPSGAALNAYNLTARGAIFLRSQSKDAPSVFRGGVNFAESRLGSIDARGARFWVPPGSSFAALDLTEASIDRSAQIGASFAGKERPIDQLALNGPLLLERTRIRGKLDLAGGQFTAHPNKPAIVGAGLRVGGQVFMNRFSASHEPFRAKGPVILHGAQFGSDVFLCEGQFDNADQTESVDGSPRPRAALSLARSTIKGLLQIDSCRHRNASPLDDDAGPLGLAKDGEACTFRRPLDLSHVRAGIFRDDVATWDKSRTTGEIRLDGFVYESLGPGAPVRASDRLKLLERMPAGEFNSQPYEHLALLLDRMGHDDDARDVLIKEARVRHAFEGNQGDCKENKLARVGVATGLVIAALLPLCPYGFAVAFVLMLAAVIVTFCIGADARSVFRRATLWWVRYGLRWTMSHGYRPLRPLYWMAGLLSLGWLVFGLAARAPEPVSSYAGEQPEPVGLFAPASDQVLTWDRYHAELIPPEGGPPEPILRRPAEYPRFNALVFAADTMLPIIDLHQEQYWQVDPRKGAVEPILGRNYTQGELVRAYLWLHILAGWTLTTLFIVGLTGLVRGHKAEQVAE
jgi:hypothetical protein